MSKERERNLFICPSTKVAGFYQQLVSGITTHKMLAARVLKHIRTAYAFCQVDRVRDLSSILSNIPIREYQLIAQYYLVWCEFRESVCNYTALENVLEHTQTYKSKALIWRATFDVYNGHSDTPLYFYVQALKANPTVSDYVTASRGIALVKSLEGFHDSALKDLERLLPLLKYAEPMAHYQVINSYAVELMEAGRFEEARNASKIPLASPFASAYPEWRETRLEIELRGYRASRSRIAVGPPCSDADNVVRLPASEYGAATEPSLGSQPARVLSFLEGKKKMDKESNGPPEDKKDYSKMSGRDLLLKIMELTGSTDRTDDELSGILGAIERVLSKSKTPDKK